jgi:DNA modification methylase
MKKIFKTKLGSIVHDDSLKHLKKVKDKSLDLIITSPPFALTRKKAYGNEQGDAYLVWLKEFGELFHEKLKEEGSLVIDFGGSWVPGQPTRNLHQFEIPILFVKEIGFHLAQEFFWWNTSKMPSPASWVTISRERITDSVNYIFWFSKSPHPKANNRNILKPYSDKMKNMIKNQKYNMRDRPSEHRISKVWAKDNGGAIPQNFFPYGNSSNDPYFKYCEKIGVKKHPARFGPFIPEFFIRFLTDKGDMVVDPFAGSCTTGAVAEALERKWLCVDNDQEYLEGGKGRFKKPYMFNIDPSNNIEFNL